MLEIIDINGSNIKIGGDDGKVVTIPIACINFPNPKVGDEVKVYKDGDSYIVRKVESQVSTSNVGDAKKKINKHVFVWVCNFLFGGLGVDRFVRGQIGTGICKLLFGWLTLGIWPLVDWIISLAKAYGSAFGDGEEVLFDNGGHYIR